MTYINQSPYFYQSPPENSLRGGLNLSGEIGITVKPARTYISLQGGLNLSGNLLPQATAKSSLHGGLNLSGEITPTIKPTRTYLSLHGGLNLSGALEPEITLSLVQPAPVITELPANAFVADGYKAELYLDGVKVLMRSFQYSRRTGTIGETLNVTLARPLRSVLSNNPNVKFELLKRVGETWTFVRKIETAKINSKSYSLNFQGDSLSFQTVALWSDKLSASPRRNSIVYNSSKLNVDISEIEPVHIIGGGSIPIQARPFSLLTLYNLLNIAFVEGCGFSSVQTNIPNFEINRCDFDYKATYLQAISGLIGVFEPLIFAIGNVLWIIDRTQALPEDFTLQVLPKARIIGVGVSSNNQIIDGYEIQYLANTAGGATSTETKTSVKYYSGFSIEKTETIKYWKDSDGQILKQETIKKRSDKKADFTLATNEIENTFDGQGKKTLSVEKKQARVPDLNNYPARSLQDVSENRIEYSYACDPRNLRRVVPREICTYEKKLIAIDAENKYLETDFTQDIQEADKAGNIAEGMTSAFLPTKTKIETFHTKRNGQIEREYTVIDHLRDTVTDDESDTRTGDISLNGQLSEARSTILFRDGVTINNKKNPVAVLAGGETPLQFLKELAARKLVKQFGDNYAGPIEVPGADENLEVGVYFSVPDRSGELGKFLTEGFTISWESGSYLKTTIDAAQVG